MLQKIQPQKHSSVSKHVSHPAFTVLHAACHTSQRTKHQLILAAVVMLLVEGGASAMEFLCYLSLTISMTEYVTFKIKGSENL